LVVVLKPLHDLYNVKRIVVSTYQSVSGAGKDAMDELASQTQEFFQNKELKSKYFTKQIAFNAIPHIDSFLEDGYTKEEQKTNDEVKKILDNKIKITSTCVRIPVMVSHSLSVNVEFNKKYNLNEIKNVLSTSPGCKLVDEHKDGGYITPVDAENKFETFISRIREDKSQPNTINLWVVSDNLLKGAALNAVEIAESLLKNDFYGK
jgi:Aspartate-semialdehyde dehydrogenase